MAHDALLCEDITLEDHPLVTCEEAPEIKVVENRNNEQQSKSQEVFKCDFCMYTTTDLDNQNLHKQTHTNCRLYYCSICEFESTNASILKNHIKDKHTEKVNSVHKCIECEKEFQYDFLLQNHICFRCYKCNFIANSSESLAVHTQGNHQIVKVQIESNFRFQCQFCDYKYKYNKNPNKH